MAAMDPYATHQRTLLTCALAIKGNGAILELGAGFYSTPLLHAIAERDGREMVTIEQSRAFGERFYHLRSDFHEIVWPEDNDWENVADLIAEPKWGVVFVDHAPANQRPIDIRQIDLGTEFVVVHDTQAELYGWGDCFKRFQYRHDDQRHVPWTTVLSNVTNVTEMFR